MIQVAGIYQNGQVKLDREYTSERPVKVIVTFLEDVEISSDKGLSMLDFSFSKSREALSAYEGSFSESLEMERRTDL